VTFRINKTEPKSKLNKILYKPTILSLIEIYQMVPVLLYILVDRWTDG